VREIERARGERGVREIERARGERGRGREERASERGNYRKTQNKRHLREYHVKRLRPILDMLL
jgi:hypothetical protein